MKKTGFRILLLLIPFFGLAQVDVQYNDLVWSDEFDTNGPVNTANWFHQTQLPASGSWFNGELQHYTNLASNSFAAGGMLSIVAKKETYTDQGVTKDYTSARLNSKFAFKYGRVDVRAKIPVGAGTWPAIWMLGRNVSEPGGYFDPQYGNTGWPACGEVDMMEHGIFPSQPVDYVQSTLHTPSSNGNSVNHGGIVASGLANDFHVYSMNWSPVQITFLLDGVAYYTYNPPDKNADTWPFDKEQFLLLNVAMGGVAGAVPADFTQATMLVDYVRVYQNTTPDTQPPAGFTAALGTVGSNNVQLLLNATDNYGTVVYTVSYGTTTLSFTLPSGQQSVTIPNLVPGTTYNFSVTASDIAGNAAAGNPVLLTATTAPDLTCSGTDTQAQQGSFSVGYNYAFETIGTDVKVTFEMLDTNHVGVVAFLWNQAPFSEVQMDHVSGNIFTKTISGQTIGSTVHYAVKFAYANGLAVTKYFPYVVGNNCSLSTTAAGEVKFSFVNPARDTLRIVSGAPVDAIEIHDMHGVKVSGAQHTSEIPVRSLSNGVYLLTVYAEGRKSTKKLIVSH